MAMKNSDITPTMVRQTIRLMKDFMVDVNDIESFKNDIKSGRINTKEEMEREQRNIVHRTLDDKNFS